MSKIRLDQEWIDRIIQTIQGLEYGSVHITVHDSQITQIERLEKHRFALDKNPATKRKTSETRYE
ncbi:YezD family protein [Brevibacillus fulvus]|uniref:DUF2292 domain-containing protein n=1 Tax=Brevibacillus fulvus TaxID=1125967 RepID=A0A938XWK8_9BACL|nr:hypothetical protein [Brevibacillus fulvus]